MQWKDIQQMPAGQFQRLTGVKRVTFEKMLSIINEHKSRTRKHPTRGKPSKLQQEDQLLMRESPVERPKKNSAGITPGKRRNIP